MADKLDAITIGQRAHKYATAVVDCAEPGVDLKYDEVFFKHFARLVMDEVISLAQEVAEHYNDYKDTALLNGDVELSNAASGEPRAMRAFIEIIRARMQ